MSMVKLKDLSPQKKLRVFDFDDSLCRTDCKISVIHPNGEKNWLSPNEYATYEKQQGDIFDYSEFQSLMNPQKINYTFDILKHLMNTAGSSNRKVVILTARQSNAQFSIKDFLEQNGIDLSKVEIVTLGDSDPARKSEWIENQIKTEGYTEVMFWDDSYKNRKAVEVLKSKYPNVKFITRDVKHAWKE
jgi:hypothetical protein